MRPSTTFKRNKNDRHAENLTAALLVRSLLPSTLLSVVLSTHTRPQFSICVYFRSRHNTEELCSSIAPAQFA